MKKKIKNTLRVSHFTKLFVLAIALTSCNERTQFRDLGESQKSLSTVPVIPLDPVDPPVVVTPKPPTPPTPPVVVTPPSPPPTPPVVVTPPAPPVVVVPPPVVPPVVVIPKPVQSSGVCKSDSSTQLLSCMKCVIPANPPVVPQLSEKGNSLLTILTAGCSVSNKSAPKNYVPPTRDELLARMNRLSPTLYPDTVMSADQKKAISDLKSDPKMQQKLFGGLWYHPPYSDSFETYFGVSIGEVVTNICYNPKGITPDHRQPLQSAGYVNCQYSSDPFNCHEQPDYVKANVYRDQLHNGMIESINNPYVAPAPIATKKCAWESFAGDYEQGGEETIARWLVSNYKVGIEISNLGGKCEAVTSLPSGSNKPRGPVKISGYVCK